MVLKVLADRPVEVLETLEDISVSPDLLKRVTFRPGKTKLLDKMLIEFFIISRVFL